MSERLLGLSPQEVGGASAKGSFALALTERCFDGDRIDALVDVILHSKKDVDPRVRDVGQLLGSDELAAGAEIGDFTIERKIGESDLGIVYHAFRADGAAKVAYGLRVLRREAARDRRAVQRFLTANRLVGTVESEGLPRSLEAGELVPGTFYVAYQYVDAQPLSVRLARTGPVAYAELRSILRGILEPLAAIHKAHLVHGDLKTESILVSTKTADPAVHLVDFGSDRLRFRGVGSVAPEIVRGKAADAKSDVYAFGCVMYELLTGKPVFESDNPTDVAFAHLTREPEPPSARAPKGWVNAELDAFVLSLLQKDPAARFTDAGAVLAALESIGRTATQGGAGPTVTPERVHYMIQELLHNPSDLETALNLEHAVDQGADPIRVGEAFAAASTRVIGPSQDAAGQAQAQETRKTLLFRAARIFDGAGKDKARAESMFAAIVNLDPSDDIALVALEDVRKALGKYEEVIEMLLARTESTREGEKARAFAEIGRLYAHELDDKEQAVVAFTQALCEDPTNEEYANEVERLCGTKQQTWTETLASIDETLRAQTLGQTDYLALLARAARWYEQKLGRADMALSAWQTILAGNPADESAAEGMTRIYRQAQQWPELATILLARADVATSAPRARDFRAEAAEILETRLNDVSRARDLWSTIIADDPGHARATDGLARIAERTGDFQALAQILERRADARRGIEKAEALARVAEVYEDHLNDLGEATRRYEAVFAIDPSNLNALKGLDRIFNRTGKYRELLDVLHRQIQVAATPRQKINLYERVAALHDEEFLDHNAAIEALEKVLELDGAHDGALTALARHYRALERWEMAAEVYDRHAGVTADATRRIDILLQRARVLSDQIGSPERATKTYEQILALHPNHPGALEALALLRESSGDAHAALSAIEALALKAPTPEARAEQWMRAGRLLEQKGDRDSAIERYKLALDAHPRDTAAAAALRKALSSRGDWLGVVGLVERELSIAETPLAAARLYAELAKVYHGELVDKDKADAAAKRALECDASNAEAFMVLGDLAFEAGRMPDAARLYENLIGRAGALGKEDGVRVLVRFLEAFGKAQPRPVPAAVPSGPLSSSDLGAPTSASWSVGPQSQGRISVVPSSAGSVPPPPVTNPKVAQAVEALMQLAPQDVDALARAANALFEFGDPQSAYRMHQDLFKKYGNQLAGAERAEALYHLGESARRSGELDAAVQPLRESMHIDPSNPRPYRALARVYDERGEWNQGIAVRRSRLQVATGAERFELLLDLGDVLFAKQDDRSGASRAYTEALQERPDDRKLLTKLMQLYSETQDWGKLLDVVLRLSDGVEDRRQRAKYMHTAATIAAKHTGDPDTAIDFYQRALMFDPSNEKALNEVVELLRQRGRNDEVEDILKAQLDEAKVAQDRDRIVRVLDRLGDLYQRFLNEPDLAVDAFEAAQAFDPEDRARAEKLAEIYAADPKQYLDKAVLAQAQILRKNPYRVESYKLLRALYTSEKKADPAWCLCQALSLLKLAEPEEERFYRKHRSENAAPAQATLDDDGWALLQHWDLDPLLTRIFAIIQPTIIKARTQPIESLGYDPRYAVDTSKHPYPVSQTLYYTQGVLGMAPPLVFQNQNDPGGLGIVHARTPAIVLGAAAFDTGVSNQALAFLAGRHLTSFRPGFYVRHLVPTGTGLKAWLFAAIKLCVPQFPVSPDLQGQVAEAMQTMAGDFSGADKERLASAVSKLLQGGGALDLKKWVASIDLTGDRVGLLLAHDLQVATEVIRSGDDAGSVPVKERMKDVVLFSVSDEYFQLRERLGVTVGG
ncbi:MAG: tetratricopeptide repeat protein [Labilithrix sp.]|nr:tetratricopeptide repeat protein [Labilithrix sp.]MCW5814309.1 tetratricopeptide repeat protein [Labilithrix sp.]